MKIMPDGMKSCLARFGVLLTTAALIAGMAGCFYTPPSKDLEIRTWYDLETVWNNLAGHHTLMNDLDSTTLGYEELASPRANQGKGWESIGTTLIQHHGLTTFVGTFDGQGYEIRDLFINRPDEDAVGLFGYVGQGGVIKDMGVVNATVTGGPYVGIFGVVGGGGHVEYIGVVNVTVTGDHCVGGLVGRNFYGTVSNSYSTGSVTGNHAVGGLAGENDSGTVNRSYSTCKVTGNSSVGGLVGLDDIGSSVSNSYSTGSVTGVELVGGLVGGNAGSVSNCYATSTVSGNHVVGGLVGFDSSDLLSSYCGTVTSSFWDTETSGQAASAGGTGKTTAEMREIATFVGAGWDIIPVAREQTNPAYTWNIIDGETYPFLSWQQVSTPHSQEPIEIVSVLGPIGLPNPAGPIVEMTLKNAGVEPVVSLTATLEVSSASGIPFDFTFDDVNPSNPLQPDGSISSTRCLIGGGFSSNEWYFLKIHATLEGGAEFVYTKRVQIKAPG